MFGFDFFAKGAGVIWGKDNAFTAFNTKLHESSVYNSIQLITGITAVASGGFAKGMRNPVCFVAGTMILTASGLAAIENIKAGDKVISTNPETFETAEKRVLETYVRETTELVHLTISGELIKTTHDHPFYVKDHGFVSAGELYIGDKLLDSDGNVLIIEDRNVETFDEAVKVYNFQVEDFHTYYVGEKSVLVHNANGYKTVKSKIGENSKLVKEAERAGKNQQVQEEMNHLINELLTGNLNPGLGSKNLFKNIFYLRGRNGARVFYRICSDVVEILGKANKGNEQTVINILKNLFGG